jgi:hypothetical protein
MPKSKRRNDGGEVFVYRTERLTGRLSLNADGPPLKIVETTRRNWRVEPGDILLFTEGKGFSLRFIGFSEVLDVQRQQVREEDVLLTTVAATVKQPSALPDDVLLSRFMYSLKIVSNFSHPWRHLPHRSHVPSVDFETLQQERVVWDRTIFFGLLRRLPNKWREFLEHESRARRARYNIGDSWSIPDRLHVEPVRELLTLVETTLLSPARLAADVGTAWEEVFGAASVQAIQVVTPEGDPERWNLVALMRVAAHGSDALEGGWRQLAGVNLAREFEGGVAPWRPHRW